MRINLAVHAEVLISILDAMGGEVVGRTVLQKLSYFISVKTNYDLQHSAHYYGPYSRTITSTIQDLTASDFVREEGWITFNDRVAYTYSLTQDGLSIAKNIRRDSPELYNIVKNIVNTCSEIVGNDIDILSWAAKVYYIASQEGHKITYKEIRKIGESFGWQISGSQIESAVELLKALQLVETS